MSWPMSGTGQWNPAFAQVPDMSMTSYTPEQWAVMQQQNWQQWAQWQQQYAQWQNQYGEKYAEQMRAMHTAPPFPPYPSSNIVPPPPPDKPPQPPPPPHENNQPLYGTPQRPPVPPAPVPPPTNKEQQNTSTCNNINNLVTVANNQNWSHPTEVTSQVNQPVNAEALKKLSEEERLFDIQFKKWEEEIEKWKSENVNHPDKQAYEEYEQKFEACRAQLLERRNQMKQKRASLLNNTSQTTNNTPIAANICTTVMPPPISNNNYNQNIPSQNYNINTSIASSVQYEQYNDISEQPSYKRRNNKNIDPQDRYESYQDMEDYSAITQENSNFLPTGNSAKGIPGLDLVMEAENIIATEQSEVIDITDEKLGSSHSHKPDYSTISKGINNILGDEKIMNILSMVRGQTSTENTKQNVDIQSNPLNIQNAGTGNSNFVQHNTVQTNQWTRNNNNYNSQQYGNRSQVPQTDHDPNKYPMVQTDQNTKYPPMHYTDNRTFDSRLGAGETNQEFYDRNTPHRGQNMPPRAVQAPLLMRLDVPPPNRSDRPILQDVTRQQNISAYPMEPITNRNVLENITSEPPSRPKWVDEPMFTPSIIVEYDHKPLRLKGNSGIN